MIVKYVSGDNTAHLLLGPVDADYEVLVNSTQNVYVGPDDAVANQDGFLVNAPTTLTLKPGDSLYAYVASGYSVSIFAQPC